MLKKLENKSNIKPSKRNNKEQKSMKLKTGKPVKQKVVLWKSNEIDKAQIRLIRKKERTYHYHKWRKGNHYKSHRH